MAQIENNQAFIDGQNLVMGTTKSVNPWTVDWWRLKVYLMDKYNVVDVYYFVGAYYPKYKEMYDSLRRAGYKLIFRPYSNNSLDQKKGNVDTDIVFEIMKKLVEREEFDRVVLLSGDGDYYRMVDYLIKKNKFKKLLAPSRERISYLYADKMPDSYVAYLDDKDVKRKLILEDKKM